MICPNCGGEYANWAIKCPYCGSTNDEANEKEYLAHLESIRQRLDRVDDESQQYYSQKMGAAFKKVIFLIGGLLLCSVIILLSLFFFSNRMKKNYEKQSVKQHEWEKTEFPMLDELYEKGDYDGILEEYLRLLNENSPYGIYDWEHYYFCIEYYERYLWMKEAEEAIKDASINKSILSKGIYGAIFLYYEPTEYRLSQLIQSNHNNGQYGISEEEAEIIRQYTQDAHLFFQESLGWSEEEIEEFYQQNDGKDGFVSLTKCDKKAQEILEHQKEK